jgi:hypothetical protein
LLLGILELPTNRLEHLTQTQLTACRLLAKHSLDGSIHLLFIDWRHMGEILRAGKEVYSELKNLCVWAKDSAGTHDEPAKDIPDDVARIEGPLGRAAQLGDVPAPPRMGRRGQQLRLLLGRRSELIAAFGALATSFQPTVQGADGAMKPAFIEQGGGDLRR